MANRKLEPIFFLLLLLPTLSKTLLAHLEGMELSETGLFPKSVRIQEFFFAWINYLICQHLFKKYTVNVHNDVLVSCSRRMEFTIRENVDEFGEEDVTGKCCSLSVVCESELLLSRRVPVSILKGCRTMVDEPVDTKTCENSRQDWNTLRCFFLPDWVEEIQTLPVLGIVKSSPVEEGPGHTWLVCARIWLQLALAQTGTEKRVRAGARSSSKPRRSVGSPRESSEPAQLSLGRVHSLLGHSGLLWDDFSWPS